MRKFILIITIFFVIAAGAQAAEYKVQSGKMDFLMDAPLEKIKGKTGTIAGHITVDDSDLKTARGEFVIDVTTLETFTFDNPDKNATQTGHMKNWFEVGSDVDEATRQKFADAILTVDGVKSVEARADGTFYLALDGELSIHGLSKIYPIDLLVVKNGEGYVVKTERRFAVGLDDHDLHPRDVTGKVLKKTLEALGQKVAETAQVHIELSLQ